MRTIILLTILAVLPISCKFYLYREFAQGENALEIAQKLLDTFVLGLNTNNADLSLSVFHKGLRADICGTVMTYSDMERSIRSRESESVPDIKVAKAVIEGVLLKFEIVEEKGDTGFFTAIRNEAEFKITTMTGYCGPRRHYLQENVGEHIY